MIRIYLRKNQFLLVNNQSAFNTTNQPISQIKAAGFKTPNLLSLRRMKLTWNLSESISNYSAKRIYWMSGLVKITDEEKFEMIEDARNSSRSRAFQAARVAAQKGSLDDYIDFLSQNIEWVKVFPTKRITTNFKL